MPMSEEQKAEFDKIIPKARKKPVAFGLCLGKKPEDNLLVTDIKKKPPVLMRTAKAEGETGKVTYGTFMVEGKIIMMTVEGKMLPGLTKNMKMFLRKNDIKMKIMILDPEGNMLESEDGDDDDDNIIEEADLEEEVEDEVVLADDDPMMGQWVQVKTALDPHVQRFVASGHEKAPQVNALWQGAAAAAAKADYKSALGVAAKIKPIVTATAGESTGQEAPKTEPEDPNKSKWDGIVGPIMALYEQAMKLNPEERNQINYLWTNATEKAEGGQYTAALKDVATLKPILDTVIARGTTSQEKEVPKDVVPFQKSRVLWVGIKSKMAKQMDELVKEIQAVCGEDPDLADASKAASSLAKRLDVFDKRLEDTLDAITNSAPGEQREALKKQATDAISAYQTALGDPFFADVDNNNGFKQVTIAADATKSLEGIKQVLAA